ncbi:MAG: hypothetical protein ACTHLW_09260 [Verrucomicrobiota bacterium]
MVPVQAALAAAFIGVWAQKKLRLTQWTQYLRASVITEWNIQSRGHGCEACGKTFTDKESYHTALFDGKADFRRSDFCVPCWQARWANSGAGGDFISCWHGIYEAPLPPTETIKKETAETLLRKLIELNDPKYMPAGYILAVMLERKRLLKVKEQLKRDGQRIFIYEHPKTGDIFTIADPDLRLDQLQEVQRDVAHLLEHGFNPPELASAATEPSAAEPADSGEPTEPTDTAETPTPGEEAIETRVD